MAFETPSVVTCGGPHIFASPHPWGGAQFKFWLKLKGWENNPPGLKLVGDNPIVLRGEQTFCVKTFSLPGGPGNPLKHTGGTQKHTPFPC